MAFTNPGRKNQSVDVIIFQKVLPQQFIKIAHELKKVHMT